MASIITGLGRPLARNTLQRFFSSSTIKATTTTTITTSTASSTSAINTPSLRRGLSRTYFSSSHPLPLSSPFRHPSSSTFFTPRFTTTTTTITRLSRPRIPPSRSQKLNYSTTSRSNPPSSSPEEPTSLSARLKKLSREYGYAAIGVYFGLSALDFPFCFLAVRYIGTERIGKFEERVVGYAKRGLVVVEEFIGVKLYKEKAVIATGEDSYTAGIAEAEKELENKGKEGGGSGPSLWTELVLAYAIHKSLIFIRVPLAAAVTPKVVKVLRGWGWDIGKKGGVREGVMELKRKVD